MSKFTPIIAIVFISLMATVPVAFATSGACSDHEGVNCMEQQANGNVICNDGWTGSAVSYDDVDECQMKPACTQAQMNSLQQKYDVSADLAQIANLNNQIASINSSQGTTNYTARISEPEANAMARVDALDAQISPLEDDLEQKDSSIIAECTALGYDDINQQIYAQQTQEEEQLQQSAQVSCPANSVLTGSTCTCNSGYVGDGSSCITDSRSCQNKFGPNSYGNQGHCYCSAPYQWNQSQTSCVAQQSTNTSSSSTSQSPLEDSLAINSNLSIGTSGSDVITLQKFLENKGLLVLPTGTAEGYFGSLTKQALISFQQSAGLPLTGYCGPMTRSAINTSFNSQ
jgi:murein L,D-transpeptidase YcbB/YkuD